MRTTGMVRTGSMRRRTSRRYGNCLKRLVRAVEELGFAGLYLADHFVPPLPPDYPSLDLIVALTYLADHTEPRPLRAAGGAPVVP